MPIPKYPYNLAIIDRVSNFSDDIESSTRGDEEFPIMSVSKSFCGTVCTLMAIDGKFGDNGINATLDEILEKAQNTYPERLEKITKYREMLEKSGFSNVKLCEVLNHTAGIADDHETEFQSYKDKTALEFFNDKLSGGTKPLNKGEYSYSNNGYALAEEIINLTSDTGSYREELQTRIIDKLDLEHTKPLTESENAQDKVGKAVFLPGHKMGERTIEKRLIARADQIHPLGQMPTSAAGLCSSINDMEKYSLELSKLITGQDNSFTEQTRKAAEIYRNSYHNCFENEGGGGYSLGVCLVPNEKGNLTINHRGGFDTNSSMMRVETPCDFNDFLARKETKFQDSEVETKIFMQQHDCLTANLILPKSSHLKGKMNKFIEGSYLDEKGVINSKKIIDDFPSFESIDRVIEEKSKPNFIETIILKNKKAKEAEDVDVSWTKRVEKTDLKSSYKTTDDIGR
ncbi:MAG: serine hydrolase [Rickettsiales bacterium]|nr:serine hydrolase [Rickettsiales bacterium]